MTLCIAAITNHRDDPMIVTASDLLLSDEYYGFSAETPALKFDPIGGQNQWLAMFAGSPTVRRRVVARVRETLTAGADGDASGVAEAFEAAFRHELRLKQEGEVLSPFGLDREKFLRSRSRLGQEEFSRLLSRLEAVKLETDFLVVGWDAEGLARVFSVHDPGTSHYHDPLGFYSIGSGWLPAVGWLYRTYDRHMLPTDLVYRVCEAKFLGESAAGVGKSTVVFLLRPDGRHQIYSPTHVGMLRKMCGPEARPMVSSEARQIVQAGFGQSIAAKYTGEKDMPP